MNNEPRERGGTGKPPRQLRCVTMNIRIDPHTLERAQKRGVSEWEIEDTIRTGLSFLAKHGRMGKAKVYDFGKEWNGKRYEQKRVEVIYTVESDVLITVTVYAFYGKWEG